MVNVRRQTRTRLGFDAFVAQAADALREAVEPVDGTNSVSRVDVSNDLEDDAALWILGRVGANADLLRALAELSPRQRATLVLRYFEDRPEAEVADLMGCTVGTVKSTSSRRSNNSVDR